MRLDVAALELSPAGDGTRLRLRVRPGARRDAIVGVHGGALKLAVTAAPERGRANAAALRLLADALGVGLDALELTAGAGSADKAVRVELPAEALRERLGRRGG